MKVDILERSSVNLKLILFWLPENQELETCECFDRYDEFWDQIEKESPDIFFIRVGYEGIPGIKVAFFSDERD